jgi:hypothetical protein
LKREIPAAKHGTLGGPLNNKITRNVTPTRIRDRKKTRLEGILHNAVDILRRGVLSSLLRFITTGL